MSDDLKTTVVGSYPVPGWLVTQPSTPNLIDALRVILKTQEDAGLDVISDGELSRFNVNHPETNGMIEYFIEPMAGVDLRPTFEELSAFGDQMAFRTRPPGVVREALSAGSLNLTADWQRVRALTRKPLKFTLTSPYMLARTLIDQHYGDLPKLCWDLGKILAEQVRAIDAPVIQVDEANLTGNAADGAWAHESMNLVLDAINGERALHLCFGNYGGRSIQQGEWRELIDFLNQLRVNHLVLECARRDPEEIAAFKDLREDIAIGVGVIDIKDNETESAETVAGRIEHAISMLGANRVRWVHPDCGFWMLQRSIADRKMEALVAGRNLFLGR